MQWAFEIIRNDDIEQVFVDSRIPSYQGSNFGEFENVSPADEFVETVKSYLSKNDIPKKEELELIRFYVFIRLMVSVLG